MYEPIKSHRASSIARLSEDIRWAHKRGKKVVTYKCLGCGKLRQFDVDSPKDVVLEQKVICECGNEQVVRVFPSWK